MNQSNFKKPGMSGGLKSFNINTLAKLDMHCYAFCNDEPLFTSLPCKVIAYL